MDMKPILKAGIFCFVAVTSVTHKAEAQPACCPGGSGAPAATGLGDSVPSTRDASLDPAWGIYEFERDGFNYLQINDNHGEVRAAIGRIKDALWVLPMGKDANRVILSSPANPASVTRPLQTEDSQTNGRLVYRTENFIVHVRRRPEGEIWLISLPQ